VAGFFCEVVVPDPLGTAATDGGAAVMTSVLTCGLAAGSGLAALSAPLPVVAAPEAGAGEIGSVTAAGEMS
jgi:hypothetical protein